MIRGLSKTTALWHHISMLRLCSELVVGALPLSLTRLVDLPTSQLVYGSVGTSLKYFMSNDVLSSAIRDLCVSKSLSDIGC